MPVSAHNRNRRLVSRGDDGIAILDLQLALALAHRAASPDIRDEKKIVPAIRRPASATDRVAQAAEFSGDNREPRQRPLGQIDVGGTARQRFERLDRFEITRQDRSLADVQLTDGPDPGGFRQARGREPQGGTLVSHEQSFETGNA